MKLIFFVFFILVYLNSFSQEKIKLVYSDVSLDTVLIEIEDSYDIKFSFNSKIISKERVTINEEGFLHDILQKIQDQTSLVFEKVNDRYYIIRKKNKEGRVSVCGYLLNNITREPIKDATILNINKSKTIVSDEKGYFQLFLAEPGDLIKIRFLGFKTIELKAKELINKKCKNVFLTEDNYELGEVLITEYITTGTSRNGDNGVVSINPSKLGILPRLVEPDVLQTLQFLPGVQSPSETASGLFIRGGTPDQNLVLWDGIKMYNSGHFFDLLSAFNPYITEEVKLYRGGTKARYGSRVSGVIDISSTEETDSFGGGFGFNMTNVDAYVKVPISKDFGLIVSGRRSYTDIFETATFKNYSERAFQSIRVFLDDEPIGNEKIENENIFYFTDYTIKAIGNITEEDKLVVSFIQSNNKLDYRFDVLGIDIENFDLDYDIFQNDGLEIFNQGLSLDWTKKWSTNFSNSVRGYFSNYDFDYIGNRDTKFEDGEVLFEGEIVESNYIRDVGGSFHTDWKINDKHSLSSGYEFSTNKILYKGRDTSFDPIFSLDIDNKNITHALYTEYQLNFNNKVTANIGIRANYFSILDKVFPEPRLNLELKLAKGLRTRFSVEHKNQVASQIINYLPGDFNLDNQIWLLADDEFSSMLDSDQFSAGFIFNKNAWNIDVDAYYRTTNGLSSFTGNESFNPNFEFFTGESEVFGLDVLIKKQIQDYRTWVSYSWSKNEFSFPDLNNGNTFLGNFDITHNLSWIHSYQLNNFEFSLGWNYRTGIAFTPANGIIETDTAVFIDFGDINSKRLDDYHRLDFSASYKFNFSKKEKWKGKIGFSLLNLYNRKNSLGRLYAIGSDFSDVDDVRFFLQQSDNISLGLTPNVSFRVNF